MDYTTRSSRVSGVPKPGDLYGEFRILETLGTGAFAVVYRAHAPVHGEVALKLSKEPVQSESVALRALREVRILSGLGNPHVVHILDHGLGPDERWYIVMELLRGEELSSKLDFDRPVPWPEAVRIVHQACLGLDEAHRAGIVHRDIKPRNLWMQPDGSIKVLDFGLARSWGNDSIIGANATAGHVLVGTPHYAQPEQVKSGRLTPASDVYSLAFILYELITGRTPLFADRKCNEVRRELAAEPLRWLTAHVQAPVVPIDHYPEGQAIPAALREIVHASLAKAPAERPATAGELAHQLAWILPAEYGGWAGARGVVLEEHANGRRGRRFLLQAGSHRLGVGACCDIELAGDRIGWVYAVVEWAPARPAVLRPVRTDGFVRVDGNPVTGPVELQPGHEITLGAYRLSLGEVQE